ncbi:ribosome biogenesis GTPase YqeH [Mycoplasmatota bacterium]|nr:ribosome biogenesis GTPase YqeH [Mycoplasmatota bacterium]
MEIKCIGCGAKIQSEDSNLPGFVPRSITKEEAYCQRCFQIKHYNKASKVNINEQDYLNILHNIEDNALIINIVDIFDFHGSFINGLNRIVSSNDVILVGNKIDLFPKSINPYKIRNWMRSVSKDLGLNIIDVELISSLKNKRIDNVIELINKYQNNRNVYVVGCTNVGKSTFINSLINYYTEFNNLITTSFFPGTTLNTIEIELNGQLLVDTPGIVNRHQIGHYLGNESLKYVTPYKGIKPIIYQLEPLNTLFFGGFVRLDLLEGNKTSFVFYKANKVPVHRTKTSNAENFYKRHLGELLSPPTLDELELLGENKKHLLKVKRKQDIVISGLGFITLNSDVIVNIYLPEKIKFFVRNSII